MFQQTDEIVDIPPNRVKFFGTTGKMLLPCPATIAAVIAKIPPHKLITTELLRKELTGQFHVEGTCPVTTKKSLKALAQDSSSKVAYWRVLNQNGGLVSIFPGGVEGHAAHLREEGFTINTQGKNPTVKQYRDNLVHFD
jgi:hypothetical protein